MNNKSTMLFYHVKILYVERLLPYLN